MGIQPLGVGALDIAVAQGDGQRPVAEQGHPRPEVLTVSLGRLAGEQWLDVLQASAVQPRPHHPEVIGLPRACRIGEIDQLIAGEIRIRQHLEQPSLALGIEFR